MRKFNLIAQMVFRKNIRSFAWWSLVLTPLLAVLIIGGIGWFISQSHDTAHVAVVAPTAVQQTLKQANTKDQKYVAASSEAAGRMQLKKGTVDAMLVVSAADAAGAKLYVRDDGNNVDKDVIQQTLSSLNTLTIAGKLGLSQAALAKLTRTTTLASKSVTFDNGKMVVATGKSDELKSMLSLAVGALMYVFLLSYGSIISQEIATEKGSRIEESILTAIRASVQFYGKIMGVAWLLLVQLGFYAIVAGIVWLLRAQVPQVAKLLAIVDWSAIGWPFVLICVAFFAIGIISYTILAALCGSLVSNQEQAGMALQPVLYLAMIGYFAAMTVGSGAGPILKVMSYVPFLSPMIMPARFGVGQVGGLQVGLALGIAVVFLVAFAWFAAKAYRANVLVYSDSGLFKAFKKSLTLSKHTK